MNAGNHLLDYILHSDVYLNAFVSTYGFWTYLALFIIVFCETGFIITPFLPGDSLLFAAGSIAAQDTNSLNCFLLLFLLVIAAILGNELNFIAGSTLGSRLLNAKNTWFFNKKHLINAHQFYTRHGGKTIFFARFLPIIRTFAPFIAGLGKMNRLQFSLYNVFSAVLWVGSLVSLGYFLGSLPLIKEHFTVVIYLIIGVSLVPVVASLFTKKEPF